MSDVPALPAPKAMGVHLIHKCSTMLTWMWDDKGHSYPETNRDSDYLVFLVKTK
jgi:hypothetical protein